MVFMNQVDENMAPGTQNWPVFASAGASSPEKIYKLLQTEGIQHLK